MESAFMRALWYRTAFEGKERLAKVFVSEHTFITFPIFDRYLTMLNK